MSCVYMRERETERDKDGDRDRTSKGRDCPLFVKILGSDSPKMCRSLVP